MSSKKKLIKVDLATTLVEKMGLNQREASGVVNNFIEGICAALEKKQAVKIAKFGNFDLRQKTERPGRNPKTGEAAIVSARTSIVFHPSQKVRKKMNADSIPL